MGDEATAYHNLDSIRNAVRNIMGTKMKIVIVNTSEATGGAAVAAGRLKSALQKLPDVEVKMLVRDKATDDPDVVPLNTSAVSKRINFLRFAWERLVIFLCNGLNRKTLFQVSIANTGTDISEHPLVRNADVIHLHWINQGFLSLKDILKLTRLGKPIVWTMHDMWPCTGICHHAYECTAFTDKCGHCPFLNSEKEKDLSYRVLRRKTFLAVSDIHIVTVSSWLATKARQSVLARNLSVTVVPNVIDVSVFHRKDKAASRIALRFPANEKIVLMGAARLDDPIKGFGYLKDALERLTKNSSGNANLLLVLFGRIKDEENFFKGLSVPHVYMGEMSDAGRIADLYSSADVTVVPSLYETFGQTIIEAMACGCPAVSFDNSGQTDIISHKKNGYLARYKDADDFAEGIRWVLNHPNPGELSDACIEKVRTEYSETVVAEKYTALYKELLR